TQSPVLLPPAAVAGRQRARAVCVIPEPPQHKSPEAGQPRPLHIERISAYISAGSWLLQPESALAVLTRWSPVHHLRLVLPRRSAGRHPANQPTCRLGIRAGRRALPRVPGTAGGYRRAVRTAGRPSSVPSGAG